MTMTISRELEKSAPAAASPKITAVIPAKNEEKNLPFVLPKIPAMVDELIMVDGLSTDGTNETALKLRPDIRIVKQDRKGKGNAVQCGFKQATGEYIVMLDADGSMNPQEIERFIEPLRQGYDMVKGSRFLPGGGTTDMEKYRMLGNRVFLGLVNLLFRGKFSDLCYGYMAFTREAIRKLNIESDGFEIETELNVKALKAGLKVAEVPSFEDKRASGASNLNAFRDGKRIIKTILRLRFNQTIGRAN